MKINKMKFMEKINTASGSINTTMAWYLMKWVMDDLPLKASYGWNEQVIVLLPPLPEDPTAHAHQGLMVLVHIHQEMPVPLDFMRDQWNEDFGKGQFHSISREEYENSSSSWKQHLQLSAVWQLHAPYYFYYYAKFWKPTEFRLWEQERGQGAPASNYAPGVANVYWQERLTREGEFA